MIRDMIADYSRNRVSSELRRFINLYIASSLLQRLFILSLIILFYVLSKELHANVHLYVAVITLLIGVYTIAKALIGSCLYLVFCFQNGMLLSPHKAIYLYTAQEIQKAIHDNHWSIRLLLRIFAGKHEKFAHELARSTVYGRDVSALITGRIVYFCVITALYMFGYKILYEKLINIDFENFFHPFIWAWLYLTGALPG